jgi:squalene-hopene/tetraprenyl-beta-curcumene cyclase
MRRRTWLLSFVLVAAAVSTSFSAPEATEAPLVDKALVKKAEAAVDRGLKFLHDNRDAKGAWRSHPGVTGIVVLTFIKSHRNYTEAEPFVRQPIQYLLSLQKEDGAIYEKDLANYITAIALQALIETKNPEYKAAIEKAKNFLVKSQLDGDEGYRREDAGFGGWGYGSSLRPDLSNAQTTADALKAAGIPEDSETWKQLTVFLSRCQNRSESNDQKWAGNDGSVVYSPTETKTGEEVLPDGRKGMRGYGSMTYAFLKSMIYANVKKDDPRVQAAYGWITRHYTLEENPELGQQGLFYYYHTMSKALAAYGDDTIVDAKGVKHNWRKEMVEKILSLQKEDGSWTNSNDRWMEQDPVLVTSYAILTLEAALEK